MAKKIPERKCMGCNRKLPKNELLRIVRSPEGEVSVDSVGKLPGEEYISAPSLSALRE